MTTEELVKQVEAKEAALQSVKDNISKRITNITNLISFINNSESKEFENEKKAILNEFAKLDQRVHKLLEYK